MRAKQIAARRVRNAELARLDRARRCPGCLRALGDGPFVVVIGEIPQRRYCSDSCVDDAKAAGR